MKITEKKVAGDNFQIDVKRFYLPFIIETNCPECGELHEHDLTEYYLAYPRIARASKIYFSCECEHEWSEEVVVNVTLTQAGHQP